MNNYFCDDEAVISFSGGRTSGFMLWKVLQAHNFKLPDYVKVCFANTGKEMLQTLDFVRDCGEKWGVNIVWLERYAREATKKEKAENKRIKYKYETRIVDYDSAARNGEPFSQLIKCRRFAPNPVARFCTVELKIRAISEYLINTCGFSKPYVGLIGIRADEEMRAAKMHNTIESGQERFLPLFLDGVTAIDVYNFWQSQDFDLQLPNNKGVTDWGNCDLCFLKGLSKKQSIIREKPSLAEWWINEESGLSALVGKGAYFRADQPSYKQMKEMSVRQGELFDFDDDETIPCFCGD